MDAWTVDTVSSTPDAPVRPVTRFFALPIVARWMLVCAALPTAVWTVMIVVGTAVETLSSTPLLEALETLVDGIGFLVIVPIYTAVPAAAVGAAVGSVDRTLGRFVERSPQHHRAARVASRAMSATLMLVSLVLTRLLFSAESVPVWLIVGTACAAVPAAICWRRYTRIANCGASTPGTEQTAR